MFLQGWCLITEWCSLHECDINEFNQLLGLIGAQALASFSQETYQNIQTIAVNMNRTDFIKCFKKHRSLLSKDPLDVSSNSFFAVNDIEGCYMCILIMILYDFDTLIKNLIYGIIVTNNK